MKSDTGKILLVALAAGALGLIASLAFDGPGPLLKTELGQRALQGVMSTPKDSFEVGDSNGHLHEVFFYRVPRDQALYQRLAAEALTKVKQQRYNGSIETLLYPDCALFMQANYVDIRYPDRSANYVITGMDITIDESGYHRKLKLSFLSDI